MNEQFDNDLKDHIKEVFDNYDDPSANEGWQLLREKFPEEEKSRGTFLWMWWGAAALLLLSLGFGIWRFNSGNSTNILTDKPTNHQNKETLTNTNSKSGQVDTVAHLKVKSGENAGATSVAGVTAKQLNGGASHFGNVKTVTANPKVLPNNTMAINKHQLPITNANKPTPNKAPANHLTVLTKTVPDKASANPLITAVKPGFEKVGANPLIVLVKPEADKVTVNPMIASVKQDTDTSKTLAGNAIGNQIAATSAQNQAPEKSTSPVAPILSMFNEDRKASANKKPEEFKTHDKRVVLGVYAATYFNYAKGSNNQVNAGAGVTADVKITNNLKLVSGLAIAQNTLSFANGIPASFGQNNFLTAAANSAYADKNYLAASVPILKNYNANLVGLDIPLNFKYEFNPKKGNAYFLAGLSSGTFINEAYTYQYNYPSISSPSLQKTQDETSSKSFNSFYFARTLNLAFGVGLPVGKNQVIVEPFLKYPLQGMGSQQISFGAGGINLKFNFKAGKK